MDDSSGKRRAQRWAGAAALVLAGAVGGGALAGTLTATAADNTTTSPATDATRDGDRDGHHGHGGADPVRSDEEAVTGADEAALRKAALEAVPGGTVYRIETDAGDGAYEAHMEKADGTEVTVKFDKDLKVIEVQDGMGTGDPSDD